MKRWRYLHAVGIAALAGAACVGSAVRAAETRSWLGAGECPTIGTAPAAAPCGVVADGAAHRAWNQRQRWTASFDGRGFELVPRDGTWRWGVDLVRWGREGAERSMVGAARPAIDARRVSYAREGGLIEWFVNDARGLEHGYTVESRPDGQGLFVVALAVRGDLCAEPDDDLRGARFVDSGGATVLTYGGLLAFDAEARVLPSWVDCSGDVFRLVVDDRGATYPLTIDPIAQQAYLKSSVTNYGDKFGSSVAVSGDTVVVGAESDEGSLYASGAAHVFVRSDGAWTYQALLVAAYPGQIDHFGRAVAISGDTVVVGAYGQDEVATDSGAAYVFVRNGTTWTQQAYLKASNPAANDIFGWSVAVSGDTVVVGAFREDSAATGINGDQLSDAAADSGAAYVFVRTGTTWTQQAYLKASNTGAGDSFGASVSISGDTIVVGAPVEASGATGVNGDQEDNSSIASGAAYVFVRDGTTWTQQGYLKASNTGMGDYFGEAVAIAGNTLLVGADHEDSAATGVNGDQESDAATWSGAAYVFVRTGLSWTQEAYLKASNTAQKDSFGRSVAVSGDVAVVGAWLEDSAATGVDGDQFNDAAKDSGAAYVFARTGTTWMQLAYLKASNTGGPLPGETYGDGFGEAVAVSGDTAVAGAEYEDSGAVGVNGDQTNNAAKDAGAAYVFQISPSLLGDLDGDAHVNASDLGLLLGTWGASGGPTDLNGDGTVGAADLAVLLGAWTG